MATPRYIVKAHTVPARRLRLRELEDELARLPGLQGAARLFEATRDAASVWSTAARADAVHVLWRRYLDIVHNVLGEFARAALGANYAEEAAGFLEKALAGDDVSCCLLSMYLDALADIIAYMLRYPLYRDPLLPPKSRLPRLLAVHQALLVARLANTLRALNLRRCSRDRPGAIYDALESMQEEDGSFENKVWTRIVGEAVSPKASVVLESLFYAVPADTRPGLNATSLLVHLLLVSGAAASIARAKLAKTAEGKSCSLDIPVIRLAGLLHDAGKPLDPAAHVQAGLDAARRLLEGLVPGFVLEAVLGLIESHHRDKPSERLAEAIDQYSGRLFVLNSEEMHTILRCSDHMMSGMDRLEALIGIVLEGKVDAPGAGEAREALEKLASKLAEKMRIGNTREALRKLYSGDWGARNAYNELLSSPDGAELVAEASEALAKLLARPRRTILEEKLREKAGWPPRSCECKSTGEELDKLLILTVVDIGGIQSGLSESFRIRSMAGFSLLVDFVTMAAVPYALTLYGAPPEAIVFTGGGTVHSIAPAIGGSVEDSEEKIRGEIVEVLGAKPVYRLSLDGIRVRVAAVEFNSPLYAEVVRNAYTRLGVKELQPTRMQSSGRGNGVHRWLEKLLAGAAKPCDSCGQRPAVVRHRDEEYCLVCAARYSASEALGYSLSEARKGLRMRLLEELDIDVKQLLGPWTGEGALDVLAAIAEAAGEGHGANYAIVKSDGNVAGAFMSSSLTATMFFERSIRLDLATKNAISRLIEHIDGRRKAGDVFERLLAALVLGYMYAGGDDSLLILPAKIALPVAVFLAYEFSAETGFLASLSIGVAAAPVLHNVWWSLQAATALLDEVAKEEARRPALEALENAKPVEPVGFIAFDYTDGWGLNAPRAVARHKAMKRQKLSLQPLPVIAYKDKPGLLELLVTLVEGDKKRTELPKNSNDDDNVRKAILSLISRFADGTAATRLREIHAKLSRVVTRAFGGLGVPRSYEKLAEQEWLYDLLALSLTDAMASEKDGKVKQALELLVDIYTSSSKCIPLHDVYLAYKYARGD